MNVTFLAAIVSATASAVVTWNLQAHQITKMELTHAHERIAAARASRAALERAAGQVAQAQVNSASRGVRNRDAAAGAASSGNGLRVASTATVRSAEDFTDACRSIIATYDTVVATGSEFIQEVAASADQCHSDLQLVQEAWPK